MNVAILVPLGGTDPDRLAALDYVIGWYQTTLPGVRIFAGGCSGEWSKGEAVANALEAADVEQVGDGVLVLADADSFLDDPAVLRQAVALVADGTTPYVIPHGLVYRLTPEESRRIEQSPGAIPRRRSTVRAIYQGLAGGGITVITRAAFDAVGGIDRRFYGWGGEDLSFGYALRTLIGPGDRLDGRLLHLWHPPAAPDLRGSPESERLVGAYTAAAGFPRRMREVIATGEFPMSLPPLPRPIPFGVRAKARRLKLGNHWIRFTAGRYETDDPDEVEALRQHPDVKELDG